MLLAKGATLHFGPTLLAKGLAANNTDCQCLTLRVGVTRTFPGLFEYLTTVRAKITVDCYFTVAVAAVPQFSHKHPESSDS